MLIITLVGITIRRYICTKEKKRSWGIYSSYFPSRWERSCFKFLVYNDHLICIFRLCNTSYNNVLRSNEKKIYTCRYLIVQSMARNSFVLDGHTQYTRIPDSHTVIKPRPIIIVLDFRQKSSKRKLLASTRCTRILRKSRWRVTLAGNRRPRRLFRESAPKQKKKKKQHNLQITSSTPFHDCSFHDEKIQNTIKIIIAKSKDIFTLLAFSTHRRTKRNSTYLLSHRASQGARSDWRRKNAFKIPYILIYRSPYITVTKIPNCIRFLGLGNENFSNFTAHILYILLHVFFRRKKERNF